MHTPISLSFWRRLAGGALLLAAPLLGGAQPMADPPGRVAYVSAQEGTAQIEQGSRGAWQPAALNWPVTTGTRLATGIGSRTELHGGWTTLRLHGQSNLEVTRLDDDTLQVALTEGSLSARVRALQPGERVELDTPQLALVADQPGEYRVDVDPRSDTTRVTVHAGSATVYGEAGQASRVEARQQISFAGRGLGVVQSGSVAYRDGFDQWVAARDALEEQSRSARYLSRDMPGYPQLDGYGEWAQDTTYGNVWYPSVSSPDWAPYRDGQWAWIEPWGWTWIDDAPWGFAPFHYGRWAQIGPRWAWVPGPLAPRPVYAPALVAFVGGGGGGSHWGVSLGGGLPGAAWFPLAPGEYWTPHYHASDRYRRRINDWGPQRERVRPPADGFYFQHRPHAITVAPRDQFGRNDWQQRRPRFGDGSRLPPGALDGSRVTTPPPRAYVPGVQMQPPLARPNLGEPRAPRPGADRGMAPRPDGPPPRFGDDTRPGPMPGVRPMPGPEPRRERERDRMLRDPAAPGITTPLPQRPPEHAPMREPAPRQWQRQPDEPWRRQAVPPPSAQVPQQPSMPPPEMRQRPPRFESGEGMPVPRAQPMPQRPSENMERGPRQFEPRAMPPPEMRQRSPRFEAGEGMPAPRAQPREREQFRAPPMRQREGDGG